MKRLTHLSLLLFFFIVLGCSSQENESIAQNKQNKTTTPSKVKSSNNEKSTTSKEVVWLKFDEGLEKGAKENKNIIIDFYTDWCHWCKVMDEKTFHNPKVAKKLQDRFITIRIDAESNTEKAHFQGREFTNMELTRAFRVTGFPSLGFLTSKHEVITVIPGYIPADQFYYILDYIDKECYKKKISLQEFIDKKGNCNQAKPK